MKTETVRSEIVPSGVKRVQSVQERLRWSRLCGKGIQHRLSQILFNMFETRCADVARTELINKGLEQRDQRTIESGTLEKVLFNQLQQLAKIGFVESAFDQILRFCLYRRVHQNF